MEWFLGTSKNTKAFLQFDSNLLSTDNYGFDSCGIMNWSSLGIWFYLRYLSNHEYNYFFSHKMNPECDNKIIGLPHFDNKYQVFQVDTLEMNIQQI